MEPPPPATPQLVKALDETDKVSEGSKKGMESLWSLGLSEGNDSTVWRTESKVAGLSPGAGTGWGGNQGGAPQPRRRRHGEEHLNRSLLSRGPFSSKGKVKAPRCLSFHSAFGWAPGKVWVSSEGDPPRGGYFGGARRGARCSSYGFLRPNPRLEGPED